MANSFTVRFGPTETALDDGDFTLNYYESGVAVDETGWEWTHLGRGQYRVTVPNATAGAAGEYDIYETSGSRWKQGDVLSVNSGGGVY